LESFEDVFYNFLANINYYDYPLIIAGDFNIDITVKSCNSRKLLSILSSFSLQTLNKSPTRVTITSKTTIDLVISNPLAYSKIKSIETFPCGFSDHNILIFNYKKPRNPKKEFKCAQILPTYHLNGYIDVLVQDLQLVKSSVHVNVNEFVEWLNGVLASAFNSHSVSKKFPVTCNKLPWFSSEIQKLCTNRDKALKSAHELQDESAFCIYRKLKNECNRQLMRAKKIFYSKYVDGLMKTSPKAAWNYLRPLLKQYDQSVEQTKDCFIIDNVKVVDPSEIADAFASYFYDSISNIVTSFPLNNEDPTIRRLSIFTECEFDFSFVQVLDIVKVLATIKPNYPPQIKHAIRNCRFEICEIIASLLNLCITNHSVPVEWKTATIFPLHKSGPKMEITNYRPISQLPFFSKILERVMHQQIFNFINKHNLLSAAQHGFRPAHSTLSATISLLNNVYCHLDNSHHVIAVFLDYSKAFDTIDHEILLSKLSSQFSFSTNAVELIKDLKTK
jgi:hypothetical protein